MDTGTGAVTDIADIAAWRARRAARDDVPMGSPPFVLEEPCPGCGARRVSTMVWRKDASRDRRVPFPKIEPHFLCRDGRVVWQEITESPIPASAWSGILGHFEDEGLKTSG
ncbi:MAG TPA: hypothetical protein VKG01_03985 [Thermoanaerobaculia bacterium]|nr:hypothetical protein [Thermoanaerobaculia bacterium]